MTIFINKEGKSGFSPTVKISGLRLHRQIEEYIRNTCGYKHVMFNGGDGNTGGHP